ncbi:hypothetical protein DFP92_102217 [Yoonia sediminilitoris]|uniref:Uncharacterized protein n=1 Tax=Yoonia sediminilitoris TaxID=1286148 RepID=A0A2T6KM21_9RHOB|nr:hypothetical protein C8N45_102217 [Yoonia sediminilitoris]RCW97502.1 hypothetical protein DFP92_102217 [Yoonia sediminilitoris]
MVMESRLQGSDARWLTKNYVLGPVAPQNYNENLGTPVLIEGAIYRIGHDYGWFDCAQAPS